MKAIYLNPTPAQQLRYGFQDTVEQVCKMTGSDYQKTKRALINKIKNSNLLSPTEFFRLLYNSAIYMKNEVVNDIECEFE